MRRLEHRWKRMLVAVPTVAVLFLCFTGSLLAAEGASPPAETLDLFPHKARIRFAERFTLEYHGTYKRIEVNTPWLGAGDPFLLFLVARGHEPPPDIPRGALVIPVPVERLALFSTSWVAFFPLLHVEDKLVGIAGCAQVSTPQVAESIRQGRIKEFGTGANGMNRQVDMERLTILKPEIVMVYGTGLSELDQHPKLLEAGFKPVMNASHMESTPLGRTEWIKFIAAFFNREAEAERVFEGIERRYRELAEKTRTVSRRPTVFCNAAWRGTWYMPGGRGYTARFLEDAGADYLWKDIPSPGSVPVPVETVADRGRNAEIWLETGLARSLFQLRAIDERNVLFRSFREGRVYNNDAQLRSSGGNDYWETGITRPDLVLADLISIVHPELVPGHERIWYRRLPEKEEGER